MSHFSRKKLRFLAPEFGPINTLWSKPRNRVLAVLLIHHAPFELKVSNQLQFVICVYWRPYPAWKALVSFIVSFL